MAKKRHTKKQYILNPSDELAIKNEGCYYDEEAAAKVVKFIETFCRLPMAVNKPFKLLPYQNDWVTRMYGWKRADGNLRYKKHCISCAKKVGKTAVISCLSTFELCHRNPAFVFICASDRNQAAKVYRNIAASVKNNPRLANELQCKDYQKRIERYNGSFLRTVSSNFTTEEGEPTTFCVHDEMHLAKSSDAYSCMEYSGRGIPNSKEVIISTVGTDTNSIFFDKYRYSKQVLAGEIEDSSWNAAIYQADGLDCDYADPKQWKKACPGLGYLITEHEYKQDYLRALQSPRTFNKWLQYSLNLWAVSDDKLVTPEQFAEGNEPIPEHVKQQPCWIGVDLAKNISTAGYVALWTDGHYFYIEPHCYIPRNLVKLKKTNLDFYDLHEKKLVTITEDETIDDAMITEDLIEFCKSHKPQKIVCDFFNVRHLANKCLEARLPFETLNQNGRTLNEACKLLEQLLLSGRLIHNGHPVLNWQFTNAVTYESNNILSISKKLSYQAIDMVDCTVNALACYLASLNAPPAKRAAAYLF